MDNLRDEKERILNGVLDYLEKLYPSGLYDWLYVHDRGMYEQINQIEDRVNESFLNGGHIVGFKMILREYCDIHKQAIRRFKENGYNEDRDKNIRTERIAELESIQRV